MSVCLCIWREHVTYFNTYCAAYGILAVATQKTERNEACMLRNIILYNVPETSSSREIQVGVGWRVCEGERM